MLIHMGMVTIRIRKFCTFSEYLEIMYASGYPQTRQISVVKIPRRKDFRITLKYVASRNFAKFAHVKCRVRTSFPSEVNA